MSDSNINKEFADFGKKMKIIAILTLIGLIMSFISFILYAIIAVIIIVYFFLLFGDIKKAGRELNNKELLEFTPRFLVGTIIRFIGTTLFNIGFNLGFNNGFSNILILLMIICAVLIIIGSILRYMAWSGLATFFKVQSQLFPPHISGKANTGAKLCKIATIIDMTIILSMFGIGDILRIIGYFKLAVTKRLLGAPSQPTYQPAEPQAISNQAPSASSANFCPNCGSSVSSGSRFCPGCGSSIN